MPRSNKFFALLMVVAFSFSLVSVASAESSEGEKSVTGFFKRLFNYPGKAVKETAGMTANTLNNTGEKVVAATGENTAAILTGHVEKTPELIGDPVVGTLETTGQAVSETVQMPVKAAEEEAATPATTPA